MPSISSRIVDHPMEVSSLPPPAAAPSKPVLFNGAPGMSPVLRCPLPILTTPSPDNLRQYYASGSIPQYRFNTPRPISNIF